MGKRGCASCPPRKIFASVWFFLLLIGSLSTCSATTKGEKRQVQTEARRDRALDAVASPCKECPESPIFRGPNTFRDLPERRMKGKGSKKGKGSGKGSKVHYSKKSKGKKGKGSGKGKSSKKDKSKGKGGKGKGGKGKGDTTNYEDLYLMDHIEALATASPTQGPTQGPTQVPPIVVQMSPIQMSYVFDDVGSETNDRVTKADVRQLQKLTADAIDGYFGELFGDIDGIDYLGMELETLKAAEQTNGATVIFEPAAVFSASSSLVPSSDQLDDRVELYFARESASLSGYVQRLGDDLHSDNVFATTEDVEFSNDIAEHQLAALRYSSSASLQFGNTFDSKQRAVPGVGKVLFLLTMGVVSLILTTALVKMMYRRRRVAVSSNTLKSVDP